MQLCAMAVVHVCPGGGVLGGAEEHDVHACGIQRDFNIVGIVESLWVDLK